MIGIVCAFFHTEGKGFYSIALLLQKDPFLTNVEVKMLLRESCLDLGYPRNRQGWGKLDIQKLLAL